MIAALGAAGLAIGLALQGSLANFAAGVLIIIFKPCKVGDFIEAGGDAGTVEGISLLATSLLTPDNKRIVVPNGTLMSGSITNYSAMPTRRIDLVVGISYDADIGQAKAEIEKVLNAENRILVDPTYTIAVAELGDSSVNLVVRPWVNSSDYWPTRFDLTENIKNQLDSVNIGIPYPQMDVHLQQQ
ncbi:MAG: small conductance mechanosensitive channel [Oceanicoccus sp.]|jgi:small conductance mechanosensitive channel